MLRCNLLLDRSLAGAADCSQKTNRDPATGSLLVGSRLQIAKAERFGNSPAQPNIKAPPNVKVNSRPIVVCREIAKFLEQLYLPVELGDNLMPGVGILHVLEDDLLRVTELSLGDSDHWVTPIDYTSIVPFTSAFVNTFSGFSRRTIFLEIRDPILGQLYTLPRSALAYRRPMLAGRRLPGQAVGSYVAAYNCRK